MSVKLIALAASYRAESYNEQLLRIAVREAEASGAHVTTLEYASLEAPIFRDTDEDASELPAGVAALASALLTHDGILLASPEYNWSMPASLKNLIDWLSVDARAPLAGKTALLMTATPSTRGGITGLTQLRTPLMNLHVWVYPQLIGIGQCISGLSPEGLVHAKERDYMRQHVADFVATTRKLTSH